MKAPILILDSHYLCHRAFHTAGHLAWEGKTTGVVFSFLKSISFLKDEFRTDQIAFCFEGENLHRKDLYPEYKDRRREFKNEEEYQAYLGLKRQIRDLRLSYLPRIGFKNIFYAPGYESDDLMAAFAYSLPKEQEVVLVTSDSDLYQCLRSNVVVYSPQKQRVYNDPWFRKAYGIPPEKWALVKALSGCSSDNVKGVRGIGEATALQYCRGNLSPKAHEKIFSPEGRKIVRRNRKLVELPFEGCPVPQMTEDQISREGWLAVCKDLGMRSLAGRLPILTRARF